MSVDADVSKRPWRAARIMEFPISGNFTIFAVLYSLCAIPALESSNFSPSDFIPSIVFGAFLAILGAIDAKTHRLPNILTLPLLGLGLLNCYLFQPEELPWRASAALVAYLLFFGFARLYEKLRHREGLGLGDAKLFAAAGAWVGFEGLPAVLFIASASALCVVLIAKVLGMAITSKTRVPFGPFLAFGSWIVWIYAFAT